MDNLKQKTMYKLFLFLSFFIFIGSINAQTAPIKKKAYVDEQKIINVEAATPRAGYISAPYRKVDGNWYEKTDAGVEQLIIDTVAMLATKYDLQNVSVDTINEIATKYDLQNISIDTVLEIATKYDLDTFDKSIITDGTTITGNGTLGNKLTLDTTNLIATKADLLNISIDTVNEIATKYDIRNFTINPDILYPDSIISKIVDSDLNTNAWVKSISTDYNISSIYPIGYTPDSIFVIPFKSSKGYGNLITQSNDFTSSANWTYPGNPDAWSVEGGYNSPNGKKQGFKHVSTNTPNFSSLGTWIRNVPVETGVDYIFSIYLKVGDGVSNDLTNVNFKCYTDSQLNTTPVNNDPLRPWVKYEIPFTSGNTSEAGNYMKFGVGGMDLGDSLYFAMPQIRRANTEDSYVETNSNGNVSDSTLFAIPKMENGVLNIDKVQRRNLNDSELMNIAIQFCHDSDDCNTVTWSYDKTLTEPIELIEGVSIVGKRNGQFATSVDSYLQQEGIIYANLNDITKNLFNYNSLSTQGSPAIIKDLTIITVSNFNIIFNTKTSLGIRLKNIDISSLSSSRFGNTGVYTEYSNGGGYENINISNAVKTGFVFDGGNTGFVRDCRVINCEGGVLNVNTNLNLLNIWCEKLDSFALRSSGTGNSILVDNGYFEAIPRNQDPNGKTFDISGANIFTLTNSLVLGSSTPLNTTFNPINLDSVNVANISNNRFGNSVNNLKTTVNTGNVFWANNTESNVTVGDSLEMIYDIEKVTVINSTLQYAPETFTRNSVPRLYSLNALLEGSSVDTSNIIDGNFHSQIILNEPTIKSSSENLLLYSEQSNLGWSTSGSQIIQTQNIEVAPDGTTTGDKLQKLTNADWFFRNSIAAHTMVVDEWYTFSTWIKVGSEAYNNNMSNINITVGSTSGQIDATKPRIKQIQLDTITKDWERVFFTFQFSNTQNFIDIKVFGETGDYVYLWGWDLERNKFMGGYENTTTTVTSGFPTLVLSDGLKLEGNVTVTDTFNLLNYGTGTVTGTATKYLAVESDGDVIEVDPAAGMDAVVANRSYVDNTAALVDLSSGQVYYNTTSNVFVVLP
jgi:hypothetical protein